MIGKVALKNPAVIKAVLLDEFGGPPAMYTSQYQAILDYATLQGYTHPSATVKAGQNALIAELVSSGIWALLDVFYNFFTDGDHNFAKINWKAPGTFQCVGTPTFTPLSGFKGNGTTTYLDTTWVPTGAGGVNFVQLNAGGFADIDAVPGVGNINVFGALTGSGSRYFYLEILNTNLFRLAPHMSSANAFSSVTRPQSCFVHMYRAAATTSRIYINGVLDASSGNATSNEPQVAMYLLARNNNGNDEQLCNGTIKCAGFGASLSGKELDLYNAWSNYKETLQLNAVYQAILDYATLQGYTLPSAGVQEKQKQLLSDLIAAGIWDQLDVFYNFHTDGDHNFAKINWKNPGTFQCVGTGHEPTFIPLSGFKGNGTTMYLNTQWLPSSGVNYVQDNASVFFQMFDAVHDGTIRMFFGATNTTPNPDEILQSYHNGASQVVFANVNVVTLGNMGTFATFNGFCHVRRTASTAQQAYVDGVASGGVLAAVSSGRPTVPLWLLGRNFDGALNLPTPAGMSVFGAGASLTGKEGALYNAWNNYKSAIAASLAYEQILAYASSQGFVAPSAGVQLKQRQLIADLITNGIWDQLDVFYNFFTDGDHNFAKINWKNPGTFQAVGTGHEPTFTPLVGFTGNGVSSYLDTQWLPSNGINFAVNAACVFTDYTQLSAVSGAFISALTTAPVNRVLIGTELDGFRRLVMNGNLINALVPVTLLTPTFLQVSRVSASSVPVYINGVLTNTGAQASTGRPILPITLLARNTEGVINGFFPGEMRCFGAGAALTGKELALYNAWNNYKASILAPIAYDAIISYATSQTFTLPSAEVQEKQEKLIYDLMVADIWDQLDVFYNFNTDGDHNFAKINWKNPGTFQAVGTGHEPTFIPLSGFAGNGTTQYLDTTWVPSLNGVNFIQNNASVFGDAMAIGTGVIQQVTGVTSDATSRFIQLYRAADNKFSASINLAGSSVMSAVQSEGFFHGQRSGATSHNIFYNGVAQSSVPTASIQVPTLGVYILARNTNGAAAQWFNGTVKCIGIGASLSGKEGALYNAWTAYKTQLVIFSAYDKILDYATLQGYALPSAGCQAAQREMVTNLIEYGIWDQMDVFYNFIGDGDADFARINWKNPGEALISVNGTVNYTANGGFKKSGAGSYFDINYDLLTASNWRENDASAFFDMFDGPTASQNGALFIDGGANLAIGPLYSIDGTFALGVNVNTIQLKASPGGNNFFHGQRVPPSTTKIFSNGVFNAAGETMSGAVVSVAMIRLFEAQSGGIYPDAGMGCFGLGASMISKEQTLYDIWSLYRTEIRKL